MNDRIKELEQQCWEVRQYNPPWFNATKFAELIVKECMACSTWVGKMNTNSSEPIQETIKQQQIKVIKDRKEEIERMRPQDLNKGQNIDEMV